MNDFSYNTSEKLTNTLQKINDLRVKILTISISPKDELRLRWEAHVDRIYASFSLGGISIAKQEIVKLLSAGTKKNLKRDEQEVIDYKKGFDYLNQNWLVAKRNVSVRTLLNLNAVINRKTKLPGREEAVKNLLDFIQSSRDHCIVLSGISYIQLLNIVSNGVNEHKLASFLAYLFLYKNGFDFRGLLKIEESFLKDKNSYQAIKDSIFKSPNLTVWLEYYAQRILDQLVEIEKDILGVRFHLDIPARNWDINDRQREILTILDAPDKSITNRGVQQLFKVSQITASRDLARLESLGIIFTHGKGRSVYYTKV